MGKTRKPRPKSGKVNPIGIPSASDVSLDEELLASEMHADGPIKAIVEQLQSTSVEEKMCALQTLTVLCRQTQQRITEILDSDIIKIIASWVMDPNKSIRNATAVALRCLSLCGVDVCENLVEQDVLTPILALLNEYAQMAPEWTPTFDKHMNNEMDEHSNTFLQAINILWNLCESTDIALENFNRTPILASFVRCMDYQTFGYDIAITVGQTLLVLSEDNPVAWRVLNNFQQQLINLCDQPNINNDFSAIFLGTLAAGILSNIPSLSLLHQQRILATLSRTLDMDHRSSLGTLTSHLPLDERKRDTDFIVTDDTANGMNEEESDLQATKRRRIQDMESPIDIEIKQCGWLLEAQKIAAEIITNLCSSDDENNEEIDSSDESVHDYDVSSENGTGRNIQNDQMSIEIVEAVKSLGLVEKLWQRAQPIAENVAEILKEVESGLYKKVNILRISSLLCLQNLCNVMSTDDLGGVTGIYKVWLDLGQQVFQGSQDADIVEATTALMRSALDHLKNQSNLFHQMTENDLQLMLNGVQTCSVPEIRANWLRMLGTLGTQLPDNLVKVIMEFILETCSTELDVWTISEAVDALMDMFSDNDWNQIAHELNLVQRSKELERNLKNKLRQQKRDLGQRYAAVCTVRTNLNRFSSYILVQQKKYNK